MLQQPSSSQGQQPEFGRVSLLVSPAPQVIDFQSTRLSSGKLLEKPSSGHEAFLLGDIGPGGAIGGALVLKELFVLVRESSTTRARETGGESRQTIRQM